MIVLDASVVIALLWAKDAMHGPALHFFERYIEQEFALHVVTRAEVLVGPTRNGTAQRATERLEALGMRTIPLPESDALPLAELRVRTGLRLPDACVVLAARTHGAAVATFDGRLHRAAAGLGLTALPEE